MNARAIVVGAFCFSWFAAELAAAESIDELLRQGKLSAARQALEEQLTASPDDPLATTQLGVVKLLEGVERLGQSNYRMGIGAKRQWMMFFRLPVPPHENPQEVTYQDVRDVIQQLIDDLGEVNATLAAVGDQEVKWNIDLAQIRIDLNADGEATAEESLGRIFMNIGQRRGGRQNETPLQFSIGLDTGDVYWLRGYTHLLSALGEVLLAYDQQRVFDHCAQLVFPKAKVNHKFLYKRLSNDRFMWTDAIDAVTLIHLLDWPLKEPERLQVAHDHLLAMIETSRASWAVILKETDNDHEWLPNPNQISVLPGGAMDRERIDTWLAFLDEATALLNGEKLAPFWRDPEQGVNIRRVFYEPRRFDLVLWIQGSAATPYLEEGEQTQPETWATFQRVFRGDFIGFAFWIN